MGRRVAEIVGGRLGRTLLELGGNNGMLVAPSADLELTVRSAVFGAAGTCGQRCTTLRRLIVHESVADELVAPLDVADLRPVVFPVFQHLELTHAAVGIDTERVGDQLVLADDLIQDKPAECFAAGPR